MPYCPECGEELEEDAKFCPECGADVSAGTGGEAAQKSPQIPVEDFFRRPELILAVSGIMLIIASLGPWYWISQYSYQASWLAPGVRAMVAFVGLIMLYSTIVELGYVDFLENMVRVLNVSAICSSIVFIGCLASLASPLGGGWGLYLSFVGSLVGFFATFQAWKGI